MPVKSAFERSDPAKCAPPTFVQLKSEPVKSDPARLAPVKFAFLNIADCREDVLTGISVLAPNSRSLYTPLGTPTHKYFLWPSPGLGTESRLCECEHPTAGRCLSIWFCQTPLRPLLALDRFPGSRGLGYPAGSDSPAIRLSILPNNRLVRWLSASKSQ